MTATETDHTHTRTPPRPGANRVLVFGDVLDDVIVMPHAPAGPGGDRGARVQHRPGGTAANTAAWLGALGAPVDFVGRVGVSDVQRHSRSLLDAGVSPHLSYATHDATGTSIVVVEGASLTAMTDRGASASFDLSLLPTPLLQTAAVVHLTGATFAGAKSPVPLRRVIGRIRAEGALLSIDPGSTEHLHEIGPEVFLDLITGVDILFPTLDTGEVLTGETDPDAMVRSLAMRVGVVAMLLPDGGAIVGRRGSKSAHVAGVATRFVDPVGAGAAFAAGFLCAWLASPSLAVAGRKGVKHAALAMAVVGGRPSR